MYFGGFLVFFPQHLGAFILLFQSPCQEYDKKEPCKTPIWAVKEADLFPARLSTLRSGPRKKFPAVFKMEALIILHHKYIYHLLERGSGTFWRAFPQRMGTESIPGYLITVSSCLGVFQVTLPLTCQNM